MSLTSLLTDYNEFIPEPDLFVMVEQRLLNFAKEKDIDIQEIAILLTSSNEVWKQEAQKFASLYDLTWQAYYGYGGTSWSELEPTLPVLTWSN